MVEFRPAGLGVWFGLVLGPSFLSPPSVCSSLPSTMTWAPCPHGVRTRGKKSNHPKPTDCIGKYKECGAPIERTRRSTSQFQPNELHAPRIVNSSRCEQCNVSGEPCHAQRFLCSHQDFVARHASVESAPSCQRPLRPFIRRRWAPSPSRQSFYLALPHEVKFASYAKRAHPCLSLFVLIKIRQFFRTSLSHKGSSMYQILTFCLCSGFMLLRKFRMCE